MEQTYQVKQKVELHSTHWLVLKQIHYIDPHGVERKWDMVSRPRRVNGLDGVDILPILKTSKEEFIILVLQYRPPLGGLCLEFPAGLVDEGESAYDAALRELKEETGYTGKVVGESPVLALDPGITDENSKLVCVEIDGDAPENQNVTQCLEETENIEVIKIPVETFYSTVMDILKTRNCAIDAKVYTFAWAQKFWLTRATLTKPQ